MNVSVFMRGTWKWAIATLAATMACAWVFSKTSPKPGVDPLQAAYDAQETNFCWNVDGKWQCSTSAIWPPATPLERMLMEIGQRSK